MMTNTLSFRAGAGRSVRACPTHQWVLPAPTARQGIPVKTPALSFCSTALHGIAGRLVYTHDAVAELGLKACEMNYSVPSRGDTVIPGAPLIISALTTSFCGTGAISDGSFVVAVGVGGAASDERARATNEERSRVGLARAPEQARRKDIGFSYGTTFKRSLRSHLR